MTLLQRELRPKSATISPADSNLKLTHAQKSGADAFFGVFQRIRMPKPVGRARDFSHVFRHFSLVGRARYRHLRSRSDVWLKLKRPGID